MSVVINPGRIASLRSIPDIARIGQSRAVDQSEIDLEADDRSTLVGARENVAVGPHDPAAPRARRGHPLTPRPPQPARGRAHHEFGAYQLAEAERAIARRFGVPRAAVEPG